MKKELVDAMNEQINFELVSAYIYLDMANYFTEIGLDGFSNYYRIQMQEEYDHANLMMEYLHNNQEKVVLDAVAKPEYSYENVRDVLVKALQHEKMVTGRIHKIYLLAQKDKDVRTTQFLDWFVKEQGEEEKNGDNMITRYDLFGTDGKGLYMLDQEYAGRVYAAPSLTL